MAQIIIIGAGLAGLSTALFLASEGHQVTLLESDCAPPTSDDADGAFAHWERRGAGQCRQTHMFLGLSSAEMTRGAPQVLDILERGGALRFDDPELTAADGTPAPIIGARRIAYELALREALGACPRVSIKPSVTVVSLLSTKGDPPRVTGVRLASGEDLPSELVVDCAGRRSMAHKWLVQAGSRPVPEQRQACGFTYLTRWYRLRHGQVFPDVVPPASARLPYMAVIVCPADRGWLSVTLSLSEQDPFRRQLRVGDNFDRVAREVPVSLSFLERSKATTEPLPFGNIANQRRSLVDEDGPLFCGYLLVGDSSMHTNPTQGRGASLAFAQARHLAASLDRIDASSVDLVRSEEQWARSTLKVWFDAQVAADAALADRFDTLAAGKPLAKPDEASRARGAMLAALREEPEIAREVRKMANMLITPAELMAIPRIKQAVSERLKSNRAWPEYVEVLPRQDFERLLA